MIKLPKQKILVELDCLLDTRIGTVARIDQDLATKVLINGYHQRLEDKFEGVDENVFKELYLARDIDTLKLSTITTFLPLLKHLCNLIYEESISRPYHSGPEIIVNVFPYTLPDEIADAITAAVERWVGVMTPVSIIRAKPTDLTARYCKDLSLIVMYDPTIWFNENLEELMKNPIRDVSLYIPQLYHNKTQTDEEIKVMAEEVMDPFAALELIMKTVIDVAILDSYFFSIFDPKAILDFSNFGFSTTGPETDPQTPASQTSS